MKYCEGKEKDASFLFLDMQELILHSYERTPQFKFLNETKG